jgi:transcriptional regulator with XRE-family HTH domain
MQGLCCYNLGHDSNPTGEVQLRLPRLREWRENRGLTQQDLADLIGTARDTISKWETGDRGALPANAKRLASVLNVEVRDLAEDFESWISRVHSIPELRRMAKDLKAQWRELAAYERVAALSSGELGQDLQRLGEIEQRLGIIKKRIDALDPPLCWITYRLDRLPEVQFNPNHTPTEDEKTELRKKLGAYEVVDDFALAG